MHRASQNQKEIAYKGNRQFSTFNLYMSRFHSYINTALTLIEKYKGDVPFPIFSKQFFSTQKNYGSRDRKLITHCCYCFFRTGHLLFGIAQDKKIAAAFFLCSPTKNELLENIAPQWNEAAAYSIEKKIQLLNTSGSVKNIFPWMEALSEGIEKEKFALSFLQQPDLFLRIRPGHKTAVQAKLETAGIEYSILDGGALVLPNGSKIENIIEPDKEVVVQDLSSQRTADLLFEFNDLKKADCWDCCVASGGKSILLYDRFNSHIDLTVSDIRPAVLDELKYRFERAGIRNYYAFNADLSAPLIKAISFNLIVCDAPCTGSGTWGRTPEQLYFFKEKKIEQFALLQQQIVSNIIPHLKKGGYLLYITCSVFKKENEAMVDFIKETSSLHLLNMELLKGYEQKADTMFVALFRNG